MRAITVGELAYLRTQGQYSKLHIAGLTTPPVVFACRAIDNLDTNDRAIAINYDTVTTGAYTDVIIGMTLWIGTTLGGREVGEARVRDITNTQISIGESSDLRLVDEGALYLTVRDEMLLWPKHIRIAGTKFYMDNAIAYTDQHSVFDPIPVMGSDVVLDISDVGRELVLNGTFDTNTSEHWTAGSGVILYNVGTTLRVDRNGAGYLNHCVQYVPTVIGKTYNFSTDVVVFSDGYEIWIDNGIVFDTADGTGVQSTTFVATSTSTRISIRVIDNVDGEVGVDTVSLQLAHESVSFPECVDSIAFGSTIASYAFTSTAGTWVSPTTSGAYLKISSYPANGLIRVKMVVTSAAGASFAGYRYIYVFDADHPPFDAFTVGSINGDYSGGGWTFDVSIVGDVSLVRDRSKVILFADDYYGDTKISLGQVAGRENLIATGFVNSESLEVDAQSSTVKFTVQPPSFWLDKMAGFPPGLDMKGTPTSWEQLKGLTVDRAVWHLLHWRCTATQVMDVRLTGDTRLASGFAVPTQSIWSQIKEIASTSILANPGTNRNGQLFLEVDPQLVPVADRDWDVVMDITKADWHDKITMLCNCDVSETAMMASSGVSVNASGKGTPYFSLSPGHVFKHYGTPEIMDRLLLSSQSQSNELAGLLTGARNNKFPSFDISLASNNRFVDIFPRSFCNLTLLEGDTIRGRAYDGNVIPRTLSIEFSDGLLLTSGNFEGESFPEIFINGDPPIDTTGCGETSCAKGFELDANGCCVKIANNGCGCPTCPTGFHLDEKCCCVPDDIDVGSGTQGAKTVALLTHRNVDGQATGLVYTTNFDAYNEDDIVWINYNEGLTDAEANLIQNLWLTPDGHVYVVYYGNPGRIGMFVAVAEGLGQPFVKLIDEAWLAAEYPGSVYDQTSLINFSVNPNAANEYAFITQYQNWPVSIEARIYYNTLVGDDLPIGTVDLYMEYIGSLEFADEWITVVNKHVGGLGNPLNVFIFQGTYDAPTDTTIPKNGYAVQFRLPNGEALWKGTDDTTTYRFSGTDAGTAWGFDLYSRVPTYLSCIATSPSGLTIMATGRPTGEPADLFNISFDAGTTWTPMLGGIPDKDHCVANGHSDQIWVASKILTNVYYSEDAGVTWVNKSNQSMADLLWLSAVNKIVVGYNAPTP